GALALLIGVATWANRPDYALLFGSLPAADAGRLVEQLEESATPYELRDGGAALYVPREQVYELRMRFAAEGLVSDGQTGYELFDRTTLGMTDFMQQVSYKRALEGELARTITSVEGVQTARVHLVLPERSAFRDRQVEPSASVVLHLTGGARPDPERVAGIAALVAGAIEGLDPNSVTILDQRGERLSSPTGTADGASMTASQIEQQRAVEDHLAERGQTMLDRMLGDSRAVVRVAAAINFNRTVVETNRIDPESQTAVSEETTEETGEISQATSTVRNYEMTRSHETEERNGGGVERLTVSVLLDQRREPVPGTEGETQAQPYTPAELREVEALVRNAVGLDAERGDRITIQQAAFDTSLEDQAVDDAAAERTDERLRLGLRYGLMIVALVLAAWLLRAATARVTTLSEPEYEPEQGYGEIPAELLALGGARPSSSSGDGAMLMPEAPFVSLAQHARTPDHAAVQEDFYTSRLSPEAKARLAARRQQYDETRDAVAEKPEEAAALIQSWLAEDRLAALPRS
ncbi:MAG TPA: flagellar basal-body MS-ring/collar protein FliF, partial [Rhodothermales bacterium]|nr:flagellar basal-body MS-ring/collar protein FliF [Rhodothermales bacterium]